MAWKCTLCPWETRHHVSDLFQHTLETHYGMQKKESKNPLNEDWFKAFNISIDYTLKQLNEMKTAASEHNIGEVRRLRDALGKSLQWYVDYALMPVGLLSFYGIPEPTEKGYNK